jgi:predicted small lipoprotein YifL
MRPAARSRLKGAALALLLASMLAACGQMGPLSLPEPAAAPAGEQEDDGEDSRREADDER